jgi:hypothetical protein
VSSPIVENIKISVECFQFRMADLLRSHHQNAGQNHNTKMVNRSFENVAKFKFLRMTVTNQNLIHKDIKNRLNSGNAFYHSVQNLLSSCILPKKHKNQNIKNCNFSCSFVWV